MTNFKTKMAFLVLASGILNFVHLFGIEKALFAIIFGNILISENKKNAEQPSKLAIASIIFEYCNVLDSKFNWTKEEIKENIKFIGKIVEIIDTDIKVDVIKEDETDNKIIECAVAADVNAIISGDKHLLNIKKYKNIPILKPADFLKKVL